MVDGVCTAVRPRHWAPATSGGRNDERFAEVTDLVTEDDDNGGRSDLEGAIAEQIAHLSSVSDTPDEFEPSGRAFDAEEVDFSSAVWMTCLAEVQGWLRLPEELILDDQERLLYALVRGLELDPQVVVIEEQGSLKLLDAALGPVL